MQKYKWIKVVDINGDKYEYENCEMFLFMGRVEITYSGPIGPVKTFFEERNIISFSFMK